MGLPSAAEAVAVAHKVWRLWGPLASLSTLWLYIVGRQARPGWQRLVAASPPLLGFICLVPCCFSREGWEGIIAVSLSLHSGATALKVVAFILNRGPLVDVPPGLWKFHTALHLTIAPLRDSPPAPRNRRPSHATPTEATSPPQLLRHALASTTVWLGCMLVAAQGPQRNVFHHPALFFSMYGGLSAVMATHAAMAIGLVGMRVALPFHRPWLSPSLGDFWSKRWNFPTARLFKCLAFDPVMEGRLVALEPVQPLHSQLQPETPPGETAYSRGDAAVSGAPGVFCSTPRLEEQHRKDPPNGKTLLASMECRVDGADLEKSRHAHAPAGESSTVLQSPKKGEGCTAAAPAVAAAPAAAPAVFKSAAGVLPRVSKARRALAVAASFALSGLFHELMLVYVSGAPSGLWFAFFILQAPLVLAEQEWLPPRGPHRTTAGLPRAVAAAGVMLLLQGAASFTWWPALEASGLMTKMTAVAR